MMVAWWWVLNWFVQRARDLYLVQIQYTNNK